MDDRLEKIESKLALSEDLLEALNTIVYRQQTQIEKLHQELAVLREQVHAALPSEPRNVSDDIPPHY